MDCIQSSFREAAEDSVVDAEVGSKAAYNKAVGVHPTPLEAMSSAPTTVSVSRPLPLSGGMLVAGSIIRFALITYRKG